jgi:hypothetical protein
MGGHTYRVVLAGTTFLPRQNASMDIRNHRLDICNHRVGIRNHNIGVNCQLGLKGGR